MKDNAKLVCAIRTAQEQEPSAYQGRGGGGGGMSKMYSNSGLPPCPRGRGAEGGGGASPRGRRPLMVELSYKILLVPTLAVCLSLLGTRCAAGDGRLLQRHAALLSSFDYVYTQRSSFEERSGLRFGTLLGQQGCHASTKHASTRPVLHGAHATFLRCHVSQSSVTVPLE